MTKDNLNVEIGPRDSPLIRELRKDILGGKTVVYLEKRGRWASALKDIVDRDLTPSSYRAREHKEYIVVADASSLPLEDESVGVIFAANVFGAHGYRTLRGPDAKIEDKPEDVGDFAKIAEECNRVISKGGKLVILESTTPYDSRELITVFSKKGFKITEYYKGESIGNVFDEASEARQNIKDWASTGELCIGF